MALYFLLCVWVLNFLLLVGIYIYICLTIICATFLHIWKDWGVALRQSKPFILKWAYVLTSQFLIEVVNQWKLSFEHCHVFITNIICLDILVYPNQIICSRDHCGGSIKRKNWSQSNLKEDNLLIYKFWNNNLSLERDDGDNWIWCLCLLPDVYILDMAEN